MESKLTLILQTPEVRPKKTQGVLVDDVADLFFPRILRAAKEAAMSKLRFSPLSAKNH